MTLLKVPNAHFPVVLIHFQPPKRGQLPYKGQNGLSQRVLYSEVPMYLFSIIHVHY